MTSKLPLLTLATVAVGMAATVVLPRSQAEAQSAPSAATMPAGNPATGAKLFLQCRACHTVNAGGTQAIGPNLSGVLGAKAASKPGYNYSPALKKANLTWSKPTMDAWLTRPSKLVPGNKMAFAGMPNPQARADMIAYLGTLKVK